MSKVKTMEVPASMWVMSLTEESDDPEIEAADSRVCVERTDEDEVAIHGMFGNEDQATVSLYVTRAQAALVAAFLLREAVS
jgi:hypothetical protein